VSKSLAKSGTHFEANIKREFTRLYKETFGKGPEETTVTILNNLVVARFDGGLSPLEQMLLTSATGKEIVYNIRDELILNQTSSYIPLVEDIVKTKLEQISYMLVEKFNTIFIFMVFEGDILSENI